MLDTAGQHPELANQQDGRPSLRTDLAPDDVMLPPHRQRITGVAVGSILLAALAALPAVAQTPSKGPPQGSPINRIAPAPPAHVEPGLTTPQSAPLQNLAPNTARRVVSVAVEGSTLLSADQTTASTQGLVGPTTPTSMIEAARLTLLKLYRDRLYPLVTVSATLTADGKLRYIITEGRIAEVQLDGDIGPAGIKVLEFLQNLVKPGPVSAGELERALLLAQDVPGVSLQTVLRPSESEPGALTLVARVVRSALSGYIAADNRSDRTTGPEQALAVLGVNSMSAFGERTEFSLFRSLLNPTQIFGQAAFETFIGSSGLKLRAYAGEGDTQPLGTLRTTGYDGKTLVGGLQASYPIIYTRQQKLSVTGIFDALQSIVTTSSGGAVTIASKDSLRILRVGADYALQDVWLGTSRPAINQISVRISRGIDGLGSSHTGSQTLGRVGSNVEFTKIIAELSRTQTLFAPWENATVGLFFSIGGQRSRDVIPSAEKYYLGGLRITRGFFSGEVTGDNALASTAELQLNTGVQGDLFSKSYNVGLQFYTFYDWGESWENRALDASKRLASFGLGLRASITPSLELDIEGVSRLTRQVDGAAGTVKPLPSKVFYWRVLNRF